MTHEQFKKAADYWKNKEMTAMPKEECTGYGKS